ncbi:unnamed protein product [Rhizophagus irregularis]|nr:unnamed protein product [Rhizophagus irregularis]
MFYWRYFSAVNIVTFGMVTTSMIMSILHLQVERLVMISGLLCDTEIITNDQQQENTPNVSQENSEHNHSANNTELTKSYSENVKTVTKCHDQNSTLDDPNVDILESENQIVDGLMQEL